MQVEEKQLTRPESVTFALWAWAVMVGLEFLHQILQVIMVALDPAELVAAAKEQAEGQEIAADSAVVDFAAYGSVAIMGLINLVIVGLLLGAVAVIARNNEKWKVGMRQLLVIFSIFFLLRGMLTIGSSPASPALPDWLPLFDGALQIIIAVAGVLGWIYASRSDAVEWFNPNDDTEGKIKTTHPDNQK